MTNRWLRAGLIAMLAGWSACAFDADYHRTRYRCGDGVCPSGYTCERSYCEPESQGAPPGSLEGCGTTELVANDFEDRTVGDATWYTQGANNIRFEYVEGKLQVSHNDAANNAFGSYETQRLHLLRNSGVRVEVPDYDPATNATLTLDVDVDSATDVSFELTPEALRLTYEVFDRRQVKRTLDYDPVKHRHWQIREQDGTIYWEVSSDGATWELLSTTSSLPFGSLVRVRLVASLPRTPPLVAPVFFDNVQGIGTLGESASWCPTTTLSDDFNDGLVGSAWAATAQDSCKLFEQTGTLFFVYPPEGVGRCQYESRTYYDLTGSSIAVEATKVDPASTIRTSFRLVFLNDSEISFVHEKLSDDQTNKLLCKSKFMGTQATPCTLNHADEHRWWRFRHDEAAARLHWETSPDGRRWTSQGQYDVSDVSLAPATVQLSSDAIVTTERDDVTIEFDNLNIGAD